MSTTRCKLITTSCRLHGTSTTAFHTRCSCSSHIGTVQESVKVLRLRRRSSLRACWAARRAFSSCSWLSRHLWKFSTTTPTNMLSTKNATSSRKEMKYSNRHSLWFSFGWDANNRFSKIHTVDFTYISFYFLQHGCIACNAQRCNTYSNSIRPSHAGTLSKRMKGGSCGLHHEVEKHSSFLIPTMVGGDVPFHLKFALKVAHPL